MRSLKLSICGFGSAAQIFVSKSLIDREKGKLLVKLGKDTIDVCATLSLGRCCRKFVDEGLQPFHML
jgi:hypothetical protein